MTDSPRLDLGAPRDLGPLLGAAVAVYGRHLGSFFCIGLAIVAPVQLVVAGIGLEELTAPYRESATTAELVIPTVLSFFVVAPLVTVGAIHAITELGAGRSARVVPALQRAVDVFSPVFLAVLVSAAGIVLGLFALIVPGLYLLVRWTLVPQAVAIEDKRATDALRRSGQLVTGAWWRTAGVVLVANLAGVVPGLLVLLPLEAAAESVDQQVVVLTGTILTEALVAPFAAICATLLFYDLRARERFGP